MNRHTDTTLIRNIHNPLNLLRIPCHKSKHTYEIALHKFESRSTIVEARESESHVESRAEW